MTEDGDNFSAEMAKNGVRPLVKRQGKVFARVPHQSMNSAVLRKAASTELSQDNNPLHYQGVEWLGPHDTVEFRRPGLQHEPFKSLKQGRYELGACLDLHSYRIEAAKVALFQFVHICIAEHVRCALVIHGKGWHTSVSSAEAQLFEDKTKRVSRIKSHVVHWLKSVNEVQAFSSAQPKDGGTGAVYVLFKSFAR
jgi:DNA-nicking Smr family endonuclease